MGNKISNNKCIPDTYSKGTSPDYICNPDGSKKYLSKEEKKDFIFGGKLPKLCDISDHKFCPDIRSIIDRGEATEVCEENPDCQFVSNAVLDKEGSNFCYPKKQNGCISLSDKDLQRSDKELTDDPGVCNRLGVGGIFNRGIGDGVHSRKGSVSCLRGCQGSKYWENPDYMFGGGKGYDGSWDNSQLKLGAVYLEASPSDTNPSGWGGPKGSPYFGNGKLPNNLSVPYTVSRGKYSPPCNISEGDIGAFSTQITGENLAGPGCNLTPPRPQYGLDEWSYSCNCPYLGQSGEYRTDSWQPCNQKEVEDKTTDKDRDVCEGCRIQDNKNEDLYGHCVLGDSGMYDTQSRLLGCEEGDNSDKCRINRKVSPIECPAFCSNDISDPMAWKKSTQCSKWLHEKCWFPNPAFNKIISESDKQHNKRSSPYINNPNKNDCKVEDTDYLCRNCAQTPVRSIGSGNEYPDASQCVVGGRVESEGIQHGGYGRALSRETTCKPTCTQCMSGLFGEPMKAIYDVDDARKENSVYNTDVLYVPWSGKQSVGDFSIN